MRRHAESRRRTCSCKEGSPGGRESGAGGADGVGAGAIPERAEEGEGSSPSPGGRKRASGGESAAARPPRRRRSAGGRGETAATAQERRGGEEGGSGKKGQ
jgi:hypothetical protein